MSWVALWARAFVVTVALELLVAVPLLRDAERSRVRRIAAVLFANLASHPLVWFVLPEIGLGAYRVGVSEAWAVACEAFVYGLVFVPLSRTRAVGISALANGVSFGVGLLLRARGLV